jgi:hypothetical protein
LRRLWLDVGREEADAVGDRDTPTDRAVVPGKFRDRFDRNRRRHLVAADRARVEHPEESRLVEFTQQRFCDAAAVLDLVGGSGDRGGKIARPRHGAGEA